MDRSCGGHDLPPDGAFDRTLGTTSLAGSGTSSASVPLEDIFGLRTGRRLRSDAENLASGKLYRGAMIDDGCRVIPPYYAVTIQLNIEGHSFWLSDEVIGHQGQLWDPLSNETALGVMVKHLLDGGVYPNRVDPGDPTLHLGLCIMNSGFVVEEVTGQKKRGGAPVKPKMV